MIIKNKLINFYEKHCKLSILDIALCGIFISLWIVSSKFISINFIFMRLGITYVWVIIIGLFFKPVIAFLIAIIGDNLTLLVNGFGFWMWEYAIICPLMALFVSLLKNIFKTKNDFWWAFFVSSIITFVCLFTLFISIIYRNFSNHSKNEDSNFVFNSWFIYILVWFLIGLMLTSFLIMIIKYFKNKNQRLKTNISIFVIISLMIVIFIWIWGPIAQIRFLALHYGKDYKELFNNYDLYFFPRILKTPVILPIYFILISTVYQAYNHLNFKDKNQW